MIGLELYRGWHVPGDEQKAREFVNLNGQLDHLAEALRHTQGRAVALDGGAHIGMWTRALLEAGFGVVHAFEPHPVTFECLKANVTDPRALLTRAALGDTSRSVSIGGDHSLGAHVVDDGHAATMLTIDSLHLTHLDLLKLDLEGYEHRALTCAVETLRRCRPVVIVEVKGHSLRYGSDTKAPLTLLQSMGYRVVWRGKPDFVLVPP